MYYGIKTNIPSNQWGKKQGQDDNNKWSYQYFLYRYNGTQYECILH